MDGIQIVFPWNVRCRPETGKGFCAASIRRPRQTIGLTINGFSGLPVEAPMLWMGITWATIIVYETIYTLLYMRSVGGLGADQF
jgi:hypothetical protein